MLRSFSLLAALFVSLLTLSGCFVLSYSADPYYSAASVSYYGPHPVFDASGNADWCSLTGVHSHAYSPGDDAFFVVDSGRYVFVGDPSYYVSSLSFDTYLYMGEHPLPYGNHWCYISGPHRHHWAASGYYNRTLVGSYQYYTYYGARNVGYDPHHVRYDLRTHYKAHPPVRYRNANRVSMGMKTPPPQKIGAASAQPLVRTPSPSSKPAQTPMAKPAQNRPNAVAPNNDNRRPIDSQSNARPTQNRANPPANVRSNDNTPKRDNGTLNRQNRNQNANLGRPAPSNSRSQATEPISRHQDARVRAPNPVQQNYNNNNDEDDKRRNRQTPTPSRAKNSRPAPNLGGAPMR